MGSAYHQCGLVRVLELRLASFRNFLKNKVKFFGFCFGSVSKSAFTYGRPPPALSLVTYLRFEPNPKSGTYLHSG